MNKVGKCIITNEEELIQVLLEAYKMGLTEGINRVKTAIYDVIDVCEKGDKYADL